LSSFEKLKSFLTQANEIPVVEWIYFVSQLRLIHLKKGDFLFKENEEFYSLCFVTQGLIHTFYNTSEGRQHTKNFAWEGRLVAPWASILQNKAANFNAQAIEPTLIVAVDARKFTDLKKRHHCWETISRKCTEAVFIERERREYEFLALNYEERIRSFNAFYASIIDRIPEYLMASYLGITPVALSRIKAKNKEVSEKPTMSVTNS
jgi:CRP-like cAMP-binding protein